MCSSVPSSAAMDTASTNYSIDLNRFTFLLGVDDGQALFDPEP